MHSKWTFVWVQEKVIYSFEMMNIRLVVSFKFKELYAYKITLLTRSKGYALFVAEVAQTNALPSSWCTGCAKFER